MSSSTLFRLSGLALLIALPLQIAGFVLHPPGERVADVLQPLYGPAHLVLFASWMFVLLGLTGFYAKQAHRAGVLGFVGVVGVVFAAAYHFYLLLYEAYATVALAQNEATRALISDGPLAHGADALGPLGLASILVFPLLGIATVRAGIFPRLSGWLQIASVPVFLLAAPVLPPPAPFPGISAISFLYYLAFLGYAVGGYALWKKKERAKEPATQTSAPQPT